MPESHFFFDSYAIIELLKGNANYRDYTNAKIVTTKLNLFEVCYFLVRDLGEDKALGFIKNYANRVTDFDADVILAAARLKLVRKADRLSMVDCIGYILAKSLGVKFLTGDEKFEHMENVEFVK